MKEHVSAPDGDAIAKLAYQIWEARGRPLGSAKIDWYEAERQLQIQRGAVPPQPTEQAPGPRRTLTGARTKRRRSA